MINLIDCIPELLKECMSNFDSSKLDTQFISMGHGLGGTTALQIGSEMPMKIKGVLTLDPWLFPLKDQKVFI
jgi:hypothetical protein